ncbi:MAG: FAD-binding oxidoreductase [Alphaproteobacteria bacterium]|nr:FAD-binding oxidoreductase [Alphaproteobacteria bacterium]
MTTSADVTVDVAVIGAGIAGASAAYEISRTHTVLVLEREDQPGYHTTGRSAALFTENYGNAPIRALTIATRPFLETPPDGFTDRPILTPRGAMFIAPSGKDDACAHLIESAGDPKRLYEIAVDDAMRRVPIIRKDWLVRALFEPDAMDIDVHALHQGYLRGLRARNGQIRTGAEVKAMRRERGHWRIETRSGTVAAAKVVNAAGAWADEIGGLAGARPIGLVPKRRTAFIVDPPPGLDPGAWPMVCDAEEQFYFKPDAGRLLASPADATPSPPCDAQPEEMDVAIAVDRIETATSLSVRRVVRKWAGLRSFVADGTTVVGESASAPGFIWLAAQGGYGIQTSAAMARVAAATIRCDGIEKGLSERGVTFATLSPSRLAA